MTRSLMERVAITTCLEVKSLLPEENKTILVWRLCFIQQTKLLHVIQNTDGNLKDLEKPYYRHKLNRVGIFFTNGISSFVLMFLKGFTFSV